MIENRLHNSLYPSETAGPFLSRVQVRNFKSIENCSLELGDLTVLVGRNGAGKSNFLDAIRFVSDGLRDSLDIALRSRGGIDAVRRKSTGHPHNFSITLELNIPALRRVLYGFEIASQKDGKLVVKSERLRIRPVGGNGAVHFRTLGGELKDSSEETMPQVPADRLYLVNLSGMRQFREVYDALLSMGFYNLNPEAMKQPQRPDSGDLLQRDGANIASVIARLASERPTAFERIREYLNTIVPGIRDVERTPAGPRETLEFKQEVKGSKHPWRFYAESMSDGTLRALGALVAVQQLTETDSPVRLAGIEEPETALHPAAAGALMDALREAAKQTQIVVTCHSPELLDNIDMNREVLLVAEATQGTTRIAPVDEASRKSICDHLYTAGELLRLGQLEPSSVDLERQTNQPELFDLGESE